MQKICLSLVLGLVLVGTADAQKGGGKVKYTVEVSVNGAGVVTSSTGGISCPGTCSTSVNSGTAITFTATPDQGATFAGWGGDCAGMTTTCSLNISAPTNVSASFEGGGGGGGPTVEELQARIEALEALVASLSASLNGFEEQFAGVSRGIDPRTNQDTLFFDSMNVAIRNGTGSTRSEPNGLGNLILGYNESKSTWQDLKADDPSFECETGWLQIPSDRTGSHNLVMGTKNSYNSWGSIVSGLCNLASNGSIAFGGWSTASNNSLVFGLSDAGANNFGFNFGGSHNSADNGVNFYGSNNGAYNRAFTFDAYFTNSDNSVVFFGDENVVRNRSFSFGDSFNSFTNRGFSVFALGSGAQGRTILLGSEGKGCSDPEGRTRVCGRGELTPLDAP